MIKRPKICVAASAGGHLNQLLHLQPAWEGCEVICVSTRSVVQGKLQTLGKTYIVGECNREHPIQSFRVMLRCLRIIMREKPAVVISTGAAPGFFICLWGKLWGSRIIWIDSIANVQKLSMSGRMIRPWADLILSQWPEVAELYRNVIYTGELI